MIMTIVAGIRPQSMEITPTIGMIIQKTSNSSNLRKEQIPQNWNVKIAKDMKSHLLEIYSL